MFTEKEPEDSPWDLPVGAHSLPYDMWDLEQKRGLGCSGGQKHVYPLQGGLWVCRVITGLRW